MPVIVADSIDTALAALAAHPGATVIAGGTDLMVEVNEGRRTLADVVAVGRVPELAGVRVDGDELVIGATATFAQLELPPTAALAPALAYAARTVGSPQIRNGATIGGNLATASPAGDSLPVLVALGARVALAGPDGPVKPVQDYTLAVPNVDVAQDHQLGSISPGRDAPGRLRGEAR